ncbi:DUF2304 domain-containing protein [Microbacterium arborescens]|uniref:DUF2304 domain-containing protein n=1 Tax=Microbacterium arborescens TaxID=33883 RepID=UPI0025A26320|nr:DUF2304 domain-containing protein [Microbacterium arborescens]WJM15018.1 DUF2304 domain-containing protein [Microbacterium arborescens]
MIVPIGIAFAVVILAIIVTMLMRRHLREKYAVMWLVIGAAMLVLAVFPDLLGALAGVLGVIVPSNLLFALAVALLIGVTLHLSWELSRAEEEIRRVAEEVAILRADLDSLSEAVRESRNGDHLHGFEESSG